MSGCTVLPKHGGQSELHVDQTVNFREGANSAYPMYVFCSKNGPSKCAAPTVKKSYLDTSASDSPKNKSSYSEAPHAELPLGIVNFDFDSHTLTTKSRTALLGLFIELKEKNISTVSVFGYTDNFGTEKYNSNLAKKRAQAVAGFLTKAGFFINEMVGEGSCCYLIDDEGKEKQHVNRRAEIHLSEGKL